MTPLMPGTGSVILTTDGYRVTYDESDSDKELLNAFNRINGKAFGSTLPEAEIR
jgi:hypothetical protein